MSRRAASFERRTLFSMGAAAALLAATGVSAAGLPRRGGRLRLALSGARRDDDWQRGDGLFMQVARQGLIFDTLTEIAADGTLRGELATGWQASADAQSWLFELRRGVTFHDGRPLRVEDAIASLAPGLDKNAILLRDGESRLRITLPAPDPSLPFRLAAPDYVIRPAAAPGSGIGTGLYRLAHFAPGQQILSERVAQHYKGQNVGWFDEVELVSIPSEPVRAQALGEYMVDAVDLSDPALLGPRQDVMLLPDAQGAMQAVSGALGIPANVGRSRPLDDLRAPERWWFS
ncbi:ABC transporter substrate-binding protein [Sulfitobacter aestuarii]|uniref:ABC transporter substrate-binding protein n=1 Tax=Sulfitobacter aestuarii TaxID=2161676 RepID=A0ABW5U0B1_9RHOB